MSELLLKVEHVEFKVDHQHILQNINLSLHAGEIVTLIGPNGAGKTTLVKIILGLLPPTSGQVIFQKSLTIGYTPQKWQLPQSLPLRVQDFLKNNSGADNKALTAVLDTVGAAHTQKQLMTKLSGGELQRVLLARALLRKPSLLVLDEPTQGVDVAGQAELYQQLSHIRHTYGCGLLVVSHDLHWVMAATDTVICLNHHICCFGHPEAISQHPEFLSLFGGSFAHSLALYTHHHDHVHAPSGNVHG